jgi:hypothetical protein
VLLTSLALLLAPVPTGDSAKTNYILAVERVSARDQRRWQRQGRVRCRTARWLNGDIAALRQRGLRDNEILQIAEDLNAEWSRCDRDRDLAIRMFEQLLAPDPFQTEEPEAARGLHFALLDRGGPGDAERATDIARMLWLRGDFSRAPAIPAWSDAERLAWLTRDDVWAFLQATPNDRWTRRQQMLFALRTPGSPRRDIVAALELIERMNPLDAAQMLLAGSEVPRDQVRAERLLALAAQHDDQARLLLVPLIAERMAGLRGAERRSAAAPLLAFADRRTPGGAAARAALLPTWLEDLQNAETAELQRTAAMQLQQQVLLGTQAAEGPLLAWTALHASSNDAAMRQQVLANVSTLIRVGNAGARQLQAAEFARLGGLVDRERLRLDEGNVGRFITTDDYPRRAMREESAGTVAAIAIISPDGRVFSVDILQAPDDNLGNAVATAAMRRIRLPASVTNGRYIRAALPLVYFTLPNDDGPTSADNAPAGAIVVRAARIRRSLSDTVQPITSAP